MRRGLVFLAGIALLAGIAALISATGDGERDGAAPAGELEGVVWEWLGLLGSDDSTLVPDDPSRYTLELDGDGRAAIRADCNRGTGRYERDGASLEIGPFAATRAACPPGSLGDVFVQRLEDVRAYTVAEGELFLDLVADAGALRFRRVAP